MFECYTLSCSNNCVTLSLTSIKT